MNVQVVLGEIDRAKGRRAAASRPLPRSSSGSQMGITVAVIDSELQRQYKLDSNEGLVVTDIDRGS